MRTPRARRVLHRCLTLLFALALGGRLIVHDCPAHDTAAVSHAAMGHRTASAPASAHAGHHGMPETAAQGPVDEPSPTCTCAGDCLCAARDGCAPARPSIALAVVVVPTPRQVDAVAAPRTDRGARLLPFANGPPMMRAILA